MMSILAGRITASNATPYIQPTFRGLLHLERILINGHARAMFVEEFGNKFDYKRNSHWQIHAIFIDLSDMDF
jgi:hypothetical protein